MCPTPLGRVHTRVATLIPGALVATAISLWQGNPAWIALIGVYLLMGVFLDTGVYAWLLRYQPPWMTGVLAVAEFGLLLVLASVVSLGLMVWGAAALYWVTWVLAITTKIVVLPIASLTYLESSFEFRLPRWSIPPPQASIPIVAGAAEAEAGPGPVLERASGVRAAPLDRMPSPSSIHEKPFAAVETPP
jgi:hypothetical protein